MSHMVTTTGLRFGWGLVKTKKMVCGDSWKAGRQVVARLSPIPVTNGIATLAISHHLQKIAVVFLMLMDARWCTPLRFHGMYRMPQCTRWRGIQLTSTSTGSIGPTITTQCARSASWLAAVAIQGH